MNKVRIVDFLGGWAQGVYELLFFFFFLIVFTLRRKNQQILIEKPWNFYVVRLSTQSHFCYFIYNTYMLCWDLYAYQFITRWTSLVIVEEIWENKGSYHYMLNEQLTFCLTRKANTCSALLNKAMCWFWL